MPRLTPARAAMIKRNIRIIRFIDRSLASKYVAEEAAARVFGLSVSAVSSIYNKKHRYNLNTTAV